MLYDFILGFPILFKFLFSKLVSGFADGDLLSFTRVKESRQRKHAPVKSLIFALLSFS
ncbi:hypothetical protein AC062_1656 [Pasteurellaceae bacterium NI1060]|nr:hypothetical protein AC062_1656 [Pasteurellaceae bacterium NI1060]